MFMPAILIDNSLWSTVHTLRISIPAERPRNLADLAGFILLNLGLDFGLCDIHARGTIKHGDHLLQLDMSEALMPVPDLVDVSPPT